MNDDIGVEIANGVLLVKPEIIISIQANFEGNTTSSWLANELLPGHVAPLIQRMTENMQNGETLLALIIDHEREQYFVVTSRGSATWEF